MGGTFDNIHLTELTHSFINSNTMNEDDEPQQIIDKLDDDCSNDVNLLDNLLIEENNAQTESDKLRQ